VFCNLLFLIFDKLFIPLISTCFYSTEGFQNFKVFYFTRKAWSFFTKIHLQEFLARFDIKKKSTGVQYIPRCIPKKDGFRVIVNKSKRDKKGKSENMILQSAYHILTKEQELDHGNSFIDYTQIFNEFMRYDFSASFILKFDIKGCFDSIPHDNLQAILIDFLKSDEYYVRRYNSLIKRGRYCVNKKMCISIDNSKSFADIVQNKEAKSNELIWDDVYVSYKRKECLIEEICKVIRENIITFGKEQYIQQKGIPQGSILSSILSSLYFQSLDTSLFNKIVKVGRIFRYVDDFLIVSPSLDEMLSILSSLKYLEKDGVTINYKKIESNFGIENWLFNNQQIQNLSQNKEHVKMLLDAVPDKNKFVTYCGLKLCCRGFKINLNFERIEHSCAYSSAKPGQMTKYKVNRFLKKILKDMYFVRRNAFKYQNLYDVFIFVFRKILNFIRKMDFVNIKFILSIVNRSKNQMRKLIRNLGTDVTEKKLKLIKNKALKDSGLKLFLQKIEINISLKRQKRIFGRII
ncbi:Telomerase catalytic subunit/reverse transcriptase TERT, partial [Trachipleistophora hominis]